MTVGTSANRAHIGTSALVAFVLTDAEKDGGDADDIE
jgi:hypothetical protein